MAASIATVQTVKDLRTEVAKWRKAGETIALVPTMGALHAGHLSLVAVAKSRAKRIVVSIFVNPTQFGPKEDFKRYPRDEAGDLAKLTQAGTHLVYIPDMEEMYPQGFATKVSLPSLTEDLCGAARPNHFEGVATVVTKLLLQCASDVAVFGEKDYQQLLVIKQLVRDLNIPVEIVAAPIVREEDGLALSSRNFYLSPSERTTAPILHQVLSEVATALASGEGCDATSSAGRFKLEGKGFRVDYVAVRDPETLAPLFGPIRGPARVMGAVYLGTTRLIDNVPTAPKSR
ncbi:pantoate--beta-alanine ligase [Methyloceanibacter sp.]|uniref:pantoate--beta-alanine ligase n=1 Tax=Methyloceanibacter sp. TaxID=1965321 RepID=UPI003D6D897A